MPTPASCGEAKWITSVAAAAAEAKLLIVVSAAEKRQWQRIEWLTHDAITGRAETSMKRQTASAASASAVAAFPSIRPKHQQMTAKPFI